MTWLLYRADAATAYICPLMGWLSQAFDTGFLSPARLSVNCKAFSFAAPTVSNQGRINHGAKRAMAQSPPP